MDLSGGKAAASASMDAKLDEQTQIPSAAAATLMCREWPKPTESSRACVVQISTLSMSRVAPSRAAASATKGSLIDGSPRSRRRRIAT